MKRLLSVLCASILIGGGVTLMGCSNSAQSRNSSITTPTAQSTTNPSETSVDNRDIGNGAFGESPP